MLHANPVVERLAADRVDDVVDVFADAFAAYPVMRFTVGPDGDVVTRERRLIRLFVTRAVVRGGSLLGVRSSDGSLLGAALMTLPADGPPLPEIQRISAEAWQELGDEPRIRYDAYAAASNFFAALPRHHHLNMIGVRQSWTGAGLGRALLESVRRSAEDDPPTSGVSLTTENPRNVELYRHFGFEVVGHRVIGEYHRGDGETTVLETWGLFLPFTRAAL